jgi:hypothetical protein
VKRRSVKYDRQGGAEIHPTPGIAGFYSHDNRPPPGLFEA